MRCLVIVRMLIFLVAATAVGAENLMTNPSAEESADNGMPKGWGRYVGAGGVRVAATTGEKHSGESAACLELDKWYTPKDAQDAPENHSVSGAIVLAENDGYRVDGAFSCIPGARYAFSFWYKGTIPAAKVTVSGWPSGKADRDQRITVPVSAKPLRPGDQWQQCAGSFRIPEGVERFVVLILASGHEAKGFRLGKLYVDDAQIVAKEFPNGELRGVWWGFVKAPEAEAGRREIDDSLDRLKAAGINSLFVSTASLYLAAFMCSDFFARLQEMVLAKRPGMWLSANGSGGRNPDWHIGRDWTTWARRGYLDFYVPQLYTKSVDVFRQRGLETKSCLGECGLVTGMAVSWSSIYPERQDPQAIKAEIAAARKLGAQGFIVFHRDHLYDEHLTAIREAVEAGDLASQRK